jgi:FkbM family methyltransferase
VNIPNTLRAIRNEYRYSVKLGGDLRSRLRLMCDFLMSHILFALPQSMHGRERQITTRSGVRISYRLNRGDIQGIREVWCDEVYKLPFPMPAGAFLDLGANIGLTTLWIATRSSLSPIIAVEPDHENALLTAKNLRQNGFSAEVVEAAVGPKDGTVYFEKSEWSNQGHVAEEGTPVRMVSVQSMLKDRGLNSLGLVKVDIEGGEQALFLGPNEWFGCTGAMIVEFHPTVVDYPLLTRTVESCGFNYIPATRSNMDCFVRCATS